MSSVDALLSRVQEAYEQLARENDELRREVQRLGRENDEMCDRLFELEKGAAE